MAASEIARTSSSFSRMCISEPRIYGPNELEDEEIMVKKIERDEIISKLLAKITSCYERVKLPGVFDAGFCFGLLDPVSNIAAGVLIARAVRVDPDPVVSFSKQRRPPSLIEDMNQRSLNGLVAFLAALFPYLTEYKALWYLNEAELDPLVAARLIVRYRGMEQSFGFSSVTTVAAVETALRCAAAAAQHPSPGQFASGWKSLSHILDKVAAVLSGPCVTSDHFQSIDITDVLLRRSPPSVCILEKSWDLASSRLKLSPHLSGKKVNLFPERSTVRRVLLNTIHGYYLQALARLPKEKLRSQYHHSLLQAGHCYGPLDPVSNILVNTIWYSRAYPLTKKVDIEAISNRSLLRIAVRSFYGLLSFLCTRCATMTPDEAMQRLQAAGADLRIADPNHLDDDNNDDATVTASVKQAYAAAAAAARHPKPHDQADLLRTNPILWMALEYLKDGDMLSNVHADNLAESLFYSISKSEQTEHPETNNMVVNWLTYKRTDRLIKNFWNQHAEFVRMVKSLIDAYSRQPGVPKYELHIICGVNERIDGPVCTAPFTNIFRYSHINFLATQSAGTAPTLFFAECRNDGTQDMGWCCPVGVPPPGTVRCLYCEYDGSRIVHPAQGCFHGRGMEFEKMWGGEKLYSEYYTNDCIINRSRMATFRVECLDDDCIYCSYVLDDNDAWIQGRLDDPAIMDLLQKGQLDDPEIIDFLRKGLASMDSYSYFLF